MSNYNKMVEIANKAHEGQLYGVKPYTYHLQRVTQIVNSFSSNKSVEENLESLLQIAYGHDLLEDTYWTASDLRREGFSELVISAIESVTKVSGEPYRSYIDRVMNNPQGRIVKIADTMANLQESLKDMNLKRIEKYSNQLRLLAKGQLWKS